MIRWSLVCAVLLLGFTQPIGTMLLAADEAISSDEANGAEERFPERFLAQHCRDCHAGNSAEGGFREESLTREFGDGMNRMAWTKVLEHLANGAMPPPDEPRPPAADLQRMKDWIRQQALPEHNPFPKRSLFSLFCKPLLPNDLSSSSSVRLARWREQPFAEKAVPVN